MYFENTTSIFTIETDVHINKGLAKLIKSASIFNIDLKIHGQGQKWMGFQTKIKLLTEFLESCKTPHFLFTDSRDTLFVRHSNELFAYLNHVTDDILISAETNCFPDSSLIPQFTSGNKYRYLNSGNILGRTDYMLDILKSIPKDFDMNDKFDDQLALTQYYLTKKFDIKLDENCNIFQVLWDEPGGRSANFDIIYSSDQIYNELTNTIPFIVHAPGPTCVLGQAFKVITNDYQLPNNEFLQY